MVLASVGLAIAIGGPGALSVDSASGIETVRDGRAGLPPATAGVALVAARIANFFHPRFNAEA